MNQLIDIVFLKKFQDLAKTIYLAEEFISEQVLQDAIKHFKEQIDLKIKHYMEKFMTEQRGNCLNRILEVIKEKNHFRKLAKQAFRTIYLSIHNRIFCEILFEKWWQINEKKTVMFYFCFTSRSRYKKKVAIMCSRRWKKLYKCINDKINGNKSLKRRKG